MIPRSFLGHNRVPENAKMLSKRAKKYESRSKVAPKPSFWDPVGNRKSTKAEPGTEKLLLETADAAGVSGFHWETTTMDFE